MFKSVFFVALLTLAQVSFGEGEVQGPPWPWPWAPSSCAGRWEEITGEWNLADGSVITYSVTRPEQAPNLVTVKIRLVDGTGEIFESSPRFLSGRKHGSVFWLFSQKSTSFVRVLVGLAFRPEKGRSCEESDTAMVMLMLSNSRRELMRVPLIKK